MKLPAGPGVPLPGGNPPASFVAAAAHCDDIHTLTAEIAVSGSAGGHRLRGRLAAGVARPASARLEAVSSFGPPLFIFAARDADATLLLPNDNRIVEHGRPDEVLEAVAGVPFSPVDLRALLTGCPPSTGAATAKRFDDQWELVSIGADDLYVHREPPMSAWELVALVRRAGDRPLWRAEFSNRRDGVPYTIKVASVAVSAGRQPFNLELALSQVDLNMALDDDAFRVRAAGGAASITLDELREAGPFGSSKGHAR
jgi:hypothetical protein